MKILDRLIFARKMVGKSQTQIAKELGLAFPSIISKYEKGQVALNSSMLEKLASSLMVSKDWLEHEKFDYENLDQYVAGIEGSKHTTEQIAVLLKIPESFIIAVRNKELMPSDQFLDLLGDVVYKVRKVQKDVDTSFISRDEFLKFQGASEYIHTQLREEITDLRDKLSIFKEELETLKSKIGKEQ